MNPVQAAAERNALLEASKLMAKETQHIKQRDVAHEYEIHLNHLNRMIGERDAAIDGQKGEGV